MGPYFGIVISSIREGGGGNGAIFLKQFYHLSEREEEGWGRILGPSSIREGAWGTVFWNISR